MKIAYVCVCERDKSTGKQITRARITKEDSLLLSTSPASNTIPCKPRSNYATSDLQRHTISSFTHSLSNLLSTLITRITHFSFFHNKHTHTHTHTNLDRRKRDQTDASGPECNWSESTAAAAGERQCRCMQWRRVLMPAIAGVD